MERKTGWWRRGGINLAPAGDSGHFETGPREVRNDTYALTHTPAAAGEIDRGATNFADVPISMRRHASVIHIGFCRSADFSTGVGYNRAAAVVAKSE